MSDFYPVFSLLFHFVPLPSPIASPAQTEKMKRREPLPISIRFRPPSLFCKTLQIEQRKDIG
ncbi:hypothetical protein B4096_0367 [Heyndrickxia coagulans]|jgi:hypothetical protein|uniref:Uncharacterized protein n=1 Tax=Heyndrickxia coagulans TaxID=1398 RepID=A0AAN0T7B5_HEYCO|nr:hypothetical protein SB48_HM08orf04867 [Heyndrickxia coagulans]KYC73627.1 hypothetical protein B4096_0367 [Heyndrickxia coagulans]